MRLTTRPTTLPPAGAPTARGERSARHRLGPGDHSTAGPATPTGVQRAGRLPGWLRRGGQRGTELGMATAEYAVATLAAAGFAGLLLVLLRSGEVRSLLTGIIRRALAVG